MILAAAAAAAKAPAPIKVQQIPNPQGAQAQQILQAPAPQTWFQMHAGWATHGIAALFLLAAISLVVLLAVQTTKQEGLSGTIGGRVESAYSRMGAEEQLKRLTGFTAVVFVVTAFVLSITGI